MFKSLENFLVKMEALRKDKLSSSSNRVGVYEQSPHQNNGKTKRGVKLLGFNLPAMTIGTYSVVNRAPGYVTMIKE